MGELEERLATLETHVENDEEYEMDDEDPGLVFVTMLPPQTEYTCPGCNGTGQAPLFEFALCCFVCRCAYTPQYVATLTAESVLPCGHGARYITAMNHCLDCGGSGERR